jgi:hypothetical protein
MAARLIYDFFVERPSQSDGETSNEGGVEAGDGEGDQESVADSNAERAG